MIKLAIFFLWLRFVASFTSRQLFGARPGTSLFSSLKDPPKKDEAVIATSDHQAGSGNVDLPDSQEGSGDGLPWWWELVWKLDIMKTGAQGKEIIFGDSANVLRTNIEQIYGGYPSLDGCPIAEGEITDIADGTMFVGLQTYQNNYGSPYKLCFGTCRRCMKSAHGRSFSLFLFPPTIRTQILFGH